MSGLLTEMARLSQERVDAAIAKLPQIDLWAKVEEMPAPPQLRLSHEGFDLIAECKLVSPSAGDLSANTQDVQSRVREYALGGAAAVSVLTEPSRFGGELAHLEQASRILAPLNVPTMRKDFLVAPYQVMEARVAGAGGVLVIARMLDAARMTALIDCASALHMFVLIEAFDADDLKVVSQVLQPRKHFNNEQILVGINCRDLQSLQVNVERFAEWVDMMPANYPKVAESGVHTPQEVRRVVELGYELALVGTSLMNSPNPRALASELIAAGRKSAFVADAPADETFATGIFSAVELRNKLQSE